MCRNIANDVGHTTNKIDTKNKKNAKHYKNGEL